MLICLSNTALAQGTPPQIPTDSPLVTLLKSCDKAYTTCQQHSADQANVIKSQAEQIDALSKRNGELVKEAEAPSRSRLLWFVAGMLVTGLTVYLVKK